MIQKEPAIRTQEPASQVAAGRPVDQFAADINSAYEDVLGKTGHEDVAYMQRLVNLSASPEQRGRYLIENATDIQSWFRGIRFLAGHYVMEFSNGHMILHGVYDHIPDSPFHSSTWRWHSMMAEQDWRIEHNQVHHSRTNIIVEDIDYGFFMFRVNDCQKWHPHHLVQPGLFALQ